MKISYDPVKRALTLETRALDFDDAGKVFARLHFTIRDNRFDYGEERYLTLGPLDDRLVVLVWTPRGESRRIISMRHANDREKAGYAFFARDALDRP